ncbi:MAG: hypothetical protein D6788_10905 [Planctomycetota bacterium]|nr:MAG: hypothetical protein D6788_10905 [Planctomycetota bacterium]
MFTALGCLAAAMSGTSALLNWMDPSPDRPPVVRPFETVFREVRSQVGSVVAPSLRQGWQSIAVSAPADSSRGTLLSAVASAPDYHFRVDTDGHLIPTEAWRRQRRLADRPGVVRVVLDHEHPADPMTRAQWDCLRALALALAGGRVSASADGVPIRLFEPWATVYGLVPGEEVAVTGHRNRPRG